MDILPDEIYILIFSFLLPLKYCNLYDIIVCRIVCKKWKRIVDDIEIKNRYLNNILSGYNKLIYENDYYNNYYLLYELDCYYNITKKFNIFFLNILTLDYVKKLPICYFKNSRCLDNMCSYNCYLNNHNIYKYIKKTNNGIMRGIDDKGRHYIIILYRNLSTNEILYEFLYHKNPNNYTRINNMVTYTGIFNKSYIGMNTNNDTYFYYQNNRTLNIDSYNYVIRLIEHMPCGIMKYNPEIDKFYESYSQLIKIL